MAHEFLIKDIAFQAGLSEATVDRVIHGRAGVRRQTAARVQAALMELRAQEQAAAPTGRTFMFDIVMEAPDRFTDAVRAAFEREARAFLPALLRTRFHLAEQTRERDLVSLLKRIGRRGSHGVVLKAPDLPAINEVVAELHQRGIPVVTLATDLPQAPRIGYAGADNRAAGQTAAYLIGEKLGSSGGSVLATLSSSRFFGEEEREAGFRDLMRERHPHIGMVEISEGYGKDETTFRLVRKALERDPHLNAVYSIGGANRAVLSAFEAAGRRIAVFVAHDLDKDNVELLKAERLSYVLHHDLGADAASVYRMFLRRRNALSGPADPTLSSISVITPFNLRP